MALLPYNPDEFSCLLEINSTHKSACQVKSRDSVGRQYKIKPKYPIRQDEDPSSDHRNFITQEEFSEDCNKIEDFLENCNKQLTFQELCYLVAYDREAIGWSAFEVIRNLDGLVCQLKRIPGKRLRVLEDFEGFLEIRNSRNALSSTGIYTYYQPFGEKIKVREFDIPRGLPGFDENNFVLVDYDPNRHGPLSRSQNEDIVFNLVSSKTGLNLEFTGENFMQRAANEVIFLPKVHPNTIHYGYSDIVDSLKAVKTIFNIDEYLDQFFRNNCVPRYVVCIEGARVSKDYQQKIADYFKKNIRGKNGQTMVLSVANQGGKPIKIRFEQLDAGVTEADFQETRKAYRQDIITSHGVPSALLNITETASLGSGRGTAQSEQYKDRFVVPNQIFWASKINNLFKYGLGVTNALIEFDPLDVRDAFFVAQAMNLLLQSGVLTINEARSELGLGPVEGGDKAFIRAREGGVIAVEDIEPLRGMLSNQQIPEDIDLSNVS